tara:strand:- start:11881 stop:12360 length:480 start_codon:yes stop_codon:yes gene_type:complete
MLEIGVAVSVATQSFALLKSAFAAGRDIEQMSGDIGRWLSAVSDVERREKEVKRPPFYKKLFAAGSVEQEAVQVFAAKKRLEKQRQELKNFVIAHHGIKGWDDLIKLEGQIRKQRQRAIYEQREARQQLIEWTAIISIVSAAIILLIYFIWLASEAKAF